MDARATSRFAGKAVMPSMVRVVDYFTVSRTESSNPFPFLWTDGAVSQQAKGSKQQHSPGARAVFEWANASREPKALREETPGARAPESQRTAGKRPRLDVEISSLISINDWSQRMEPAGLLPRPNHGYLVVPSWEIPPVACGPPLAAWAACSLTVQTAEA